MTEKEEAVRLANQVLEKAYLDRRDIAVLARQFLRAREEIEALRAALGVMIRDVDEWCDAVDRDASWDGWDHHFKHIKYHGLNHARAVLDNFTVPKITAKADGTGDN